jgi:hypothetical protein
MDDENEPPPPVLLLLLLPASAAAAAAAARLVSGKLKSDTPLLTLLLLLLVDGTAVTGVIPAFLEARCAAALDSAEGILTEAFSNDVGGGGVWIVVVAKGTDDDGVIVVVLGRLLWLRRGLNEIVGTTVGTGVGVVVAAAGLDDKLLKEVLRGMVAVKLNGWDFAAAARVEDDVDEAAAGVAGVCGRGVDVDRLGSLNDITNGVGVDVVNVLEGPDRPGVEDPRVVVGFNDDRSAVATTEVVVA